MNDEISYRDDFDRKELIDGQTVKMISSGTNHAIITGNISIIFLCYINEKMEKTDEALGHGTTVFLTERDHFIPDMMIVCDPDKIKDDGIYGAPDLVVEVLSPSTAKYDKGKKKEVYGRCGVREYWLVSPGDKSVEVYRTTGTELVFYDIYTLYPDWMLAKMSEAERAAVQTHFKCSLYDDLDISLEDIFRRVR